MQRVDKIVSLWHRTKLLIPTFPLGASGNAATEDVVYMLHGMGCNTGIYLPDLVMVGRFICDKLERESESKVTRAMKNVKPITCRGPA